MTKYITLILSLFIAANLPAVDYPLTGEVETYSDPYSKIRTSFEGETLRADYEMLPGAEYTFSGISLPAPSQLPQPSVHGGIRLQIRGSGPVLLQLVTSATSSEYNHYSFVLDAAEEWQTLEIPFDQFMQLWGRQIPLDLSGFSALNIQKGSQIRETGYFEVRRVEILAPGILTEPFLTITSLDGPQMNQLGYRPGSSKEFTIKRNSLNAGDPFRIIDADSGETVFSGEFSKVINDRPSSGEIVLRGDFSFFSKSGRYRIIAGGLESAPFIVSDNVYGDLYRTALNCYTVNRCGTAVNDEISGIGHQPCHRQDIISEDVVGINRDFTGGWHNAGDFGKWTHISSMSISHMLILMQWQQDGILKTDEDYSPLMREIEWGLEWLMKMQNPDGSVFHKVDTDPDFATGAAPEDDPLRRFARYGTRGETRPSTIDAACFTAVMFQASRVLAETDPGRASACRRAAEKSLAWLETRSPSPQTDPWYTDADGSQEMIWAYAEAYRETGREIYLRRCRMYVKQSEWGFPSWTDPAMLGIASLLESGVLNTRDSEDFLNRLEFKARGYLILSETSGYGCALAPGDYHWGSNQSSAGRGTAMIFAWRFTGDESFLRGAQRQLDYLLGCNSLGQSYISGYGTRPVEHPYHWAETAYGLALPGWLTGGPNQFVGTMSQADFYRRLLINNGAPPAKSYADRAGSFGSWSSNEGALDHQMSFLLLAGYFAKSGDFTSNY